MPLVTNCYGSVIGVTSSGGPITAVGHQSWRVRIPLGRDPAGKLLHHGKTLSGSKKNAQAYVDWITSMVAASESVTATVSQSELRKLHALQAKADWFREKLEAAMRAGAKVEPGPLHLD